MSDEQRRVRDFQPQPEGLGLFLLPTALSAINVERLHRMTSALLGIKIASSRRK